MWSRSAVGAEMSRVRPASCRCCEADGAHQVPLLLSEMEMVHLLRFSFFFYSMVNEQLRLELIIS